MLRPSREAMASLVRPSTHSSTISSSLGDSSRVDIFVHGNPVVEQQLESRSVYFLALSHLNKTVRLEFKALVQIGLPIRGGDNDYGQPSSRLATADPSEHVEPACIWNCEIEQNEGGDGGVPLEKHLAGLVTVPCDSNVAIYSGV